MKVIAIMLSVLVMVLTAMPCSDVHAIDSHSVSIEFQEQNQIPVNDIDLCSPFCFCQCCQTLTFPSFYSGLFITLVKTTVDLKFIESLYSNPAILIWHPPKI